MTDFIDRASDRSAEMLSDHLQEQQRRAGLAGKTVADSGVNCVECGDEIPQRRREAYPGVTLCIACKRDRERYGRL